jgi:hypothetical protein
MKAVSAAYQLGMHNSKHKCWHTAAFPVHAGTCSSACGVANEFSRPQGQELRDSMMAIDAAGTKVVEEADPYKICPKVQYL